MEDPLGPEDSMSDLLTAFSPDPEGTSWDLDY
jgi:hypothetical protein